MASPSRTDTAQPAESPAAIAVVLDEPLDEDANDDELVGLIAGWVAVLDWVAELDGIV